jgi:signal transduction histidine kinase
VERPLNTALGWRIPPKLLTIGPVALILIEGLFAIRFHNDGIRPVSAAVLAVGLAISAVALLLRHRSPLATLAVVCAVTLGLNYGPIAMLPLLLAVFTVAEYSERPKMVAAAIAAGAVLVITPFVHGVSDSPTAVLSRLVAAGLALALGLYLRARADYIIGLRERAERLERERELLAGQAVAHEQVRIARELHDVVAHNVSLMVVQAQALAATGSEAPERTQALHRVADLGREAMSEMHRMLGVLRPNGAGDALELAPQPGVRDLDSLIARARETGLDATLTVVGEPRELPAGVDLSAYRIAQEALTNVIRHAAAKHVEVTLSFGAHALEVNVLDDGVGPGANGSGADGHGLVGMRERVALFSGSLTAGAAPGGRGYLVHAVLPL